MPPQELVVRLTPFRLVFKPSTKEGSISGPRELMSGLDLFMLAGDPIRRGPTDKGRQKTPAGGVETQGKARAVSQSSASL